MNLQNALQGENISVFTVVEDAKLCITQQGKREFKKLSTTPYRADRSWTFGLHEMQSLSSHLSVHTRNPRVF